MTIPEYTCPNCGHEDPTVAADIKAAAVMAMEMTRRTMADPDAAAAAAERIDELGRITKQVGETPAQATSRRERRRRQ